MPYAARPAFLARALTLALAFVLVTIAHAQPDAPAQAHLTIDATDIDRKLLRGTFTIHLTPQLRDSAALHGGRLPLWYPKWVPGTHAPSGPVQNIGGLTITDNDGSPVAWERDPDEVCRIFARLPDAAHAITLDITYITDQPTVNSDGVDSFGRESIAVISPNTVLMYPEAIDATTWTVSLTLALPADWQAACALTTAPDITAPDGAIAASAPRDDTAIAYAETSLELLIDTPIMAGRHYKMYELNEPGVDAAPHRLHVFSEIPSAVNIHQDVLSNYRKMVTQAARLFASQPFDSMDILLATSNQLDPNGLEHLRTTLNVIPLNTLDNPASLTGWNRMLVPHEYVHAWCGKYRRPAGMVTGNMHTPQRTELLWVYEGLTQYLGEVLEVRSGMQPIDEYRWEVAGRVRWAKLQQGRAWRSLADTGAASHTLRGWSARWSHLRRGQDYYNEGAMVWMEADAIIRRLTEGSRSLDDFCRAFFARADNDTAPKPYDRAEVIRTLTDVADFDWDAFIRDRVETPRERPILSVVQELGYTLEYTNQPPRGPNNERTDPLDTRDSLGMRVRSNGTIDDVQLDSPAHAAGLGPDMRIVGINGYTFSPARFADALHASTLSGSLELLLASGDKLVTHTIAYDGGPRFMTLLRDNDSPDRLAQILAPRE